MNIPIPESLGNFKTELQSFHPESQSKIKYNAETWTKRIKHPSLDIIIKQFPNDISRPDVINLAKQATKSNNQDDMITTFLGAMIWGYGTVGYGSWRTQQMLQDTRLPSTIEQTFQNIADSNLEQAWNNFKINRCGSAFFTKFFYFVGMGFEIQQYPLVLDSLVQQSLIKLIGKSAPRLNKAKDYVNYLEMCHTWAEELECRADAIEYILFSQPTGLIS